jgi:hypothetical protein
MHTGGTHPAVTSILNCLSVKHNKPSPQLFECRVTFPGESWRNRNASHSEQTEWRSLRVVNDALRLASRAISLGYKAKVSTSKVSRTTTLYGTSTLGKEEGCTFPSCMCRYQDIRTRTALRDWY